MFTLIFTIEAVIKLFSLSKDYFSVSWNNFDLFIVIMSLPDLIIYFGDVGDVPGMSQLAGIIKIFRLVRLQDVCCNDRLPSLSMSLGIA